jgi:hypothetical protein
MGWTEEAFQRQTDPRCNMRANRIKDYYHGYPHTHAYVTTRTPPWTRYPDWLEALEELREWCRDNCQGHWRDDILRVYKQTAISWDSTTEEEWHINDIGGADALFVAFTDERDYMLFLLKWT